jgi:hypothetical protein
MFGNACCTRPWLVSVVGIVVLAVSLVITSQVHACAPPHVGDQFLFNNGQLWEINKPINDCGEKFGGFDSGKFKVYMCQVVGQDAGQYGAPGKYCHWVLFPKSTDGIWRISYGEIQPIDPTRLQRLDCLDVAMNGSGTFSRVVDEDEFKVLQKECVIRYGIKLPADYNDLTDRK